MCIKTWLRAGLWKKSKDAGIDYTKVRCCVKISSGGDELSISEWLGLEEAVVIYRHRFHNIGWLMRNVNECMARGANKEDKSGYIEHYYNSILERIGLNTDQ